LVFYHSNVIESYEIRGMHRDVEDAVPYEYDAMNRMARGTNGAGETSHYTYNGFGHLVASEMTIQRNNYGYTGTEVQKSYVLDYTSPLAHDMMEYEGGSTGLTLGFLCTYCMSGRGMRIVFHYLT